MDLFEVNDWRRTLGYLPVPLRSVDTSRCFVMLNGAKGNFCLDVGEEHREPKEQRKVAWSADLDHYIYVTASGVQVLRWDQPEAIHSSLADVVNNLTAFQSYLETARAPREQSVVAHALAIYNRIRSILPQNTQGLEAFLFALYSSVKTENVDLRWHDQERCQEAWLSVDTNSQTRIMSDLLAPKATDKRPEISLVLRHAMGRIFQEAHNLVMLSPQMSLLGESDLLVLGSSSRATGAYFTPTPLVRTLVEQCITTEVLAKPRLTILDPACGSGEFLRECLRQLSLKKYTGQVQITGFDVSLPAVLMARFALAHEALSWGSRASIQITQCDALSTEWPQGTDICLMNPPYASWRTLSVSARQQLTEQLGDLARSRPDIAFAFLIKGAMCLGADGMIGAVTPASLLDGTSAEPLRERLDQFMAKRVLVRLGNQSIFDQATVDASLYVASRRNDQAVGQTRTLMVWADHTSGASDRALRTLRSLDWRPSDGAVELEDPHFSVYSDTDSENLSWAPRPLASSKILSRYQSLPKLSAIYSVNQGTITGLNSAFLLEEAEFKALPREERKFFRKAIVNSSVRNGRIVDGHWVFFPYGPALRSLDSEESLNVLLPQYTQLYLLPNKAALQRRAGMGDQGWWHLTRKRSIHERRTPKVVSTYFGDAGSFAWDATGEYVVVQGYVWTPRNSNADSERVGLATVAVLGSTIAARLIGAISNNLSGGQFNLSARFMGKMPFVNMNAVAFKDQVDALARIGLDISKGDLTDQALQDRLSEDLFNIAVAALR